MPEVGMYRNYVIGINGTLALRSIQWRKNKVRARFCSGAMGVYSMDVQESQSLETGDFVQLLHLLPVTT